MAATLSIPRLENPVEEGDWQATVSGVAQSWTSEWT